jgi:capsular polysaccharide biosynthesis protein
MELTNATRHRLRVAVASALVGVLVGAAVVTAVLTQSPEYDARISLVAVPVGADQNGSAGQYGEVVSLGLPALTELAVSPSILRSVASSVPGSPPASDLYGAVTVDLVPSSGVARLTVRAGSADLAANLAERLTQAVVATDVLAPSARLRALDTQADVEKTAPSTSLGLGLALIAAVLAALTAGLFLRPFRPRTSGSAAVLAALAETGRRPVAVLDGRDPVLVNRIMVLQQASSRPLRLVPVGPGLDSRIDSLSGALSENEARLSVNGDAARAAVVALMDRRNSKQDELMSALNALPRESVLVAVVLE